MPSITTAVKILQFGNCAPDNNPTAGNVRWITTRSGHVWKADEIPKCAADNNSRILPTAQIVLWITTCRPQKKVRIVRPITTIFFALRCTPHRNCAADNNPARRKLCGGFQCRLPEIVCRITTCIKEAARQTVPPITIQPVENWCRGIPTPAARSGEMSPDNNPARRRKKRRRCWNKRHSLK